MLEESQMQYQNNGVCRHASDMWQKNESNTHLVGDVLILLIFRFFLGADCSKLILASKTPMSTSILIRACLFSIAFRSNSEMSPQEKSSIGENFVWLVLLSDPYPDDCEKLIKLVNDQTKNYSSLHSQLDTFFCILPS